ncbi:MAG: DUF885 family protein [Alphaproteobacteria bacterium]|nr:DUF885 family protein [Alphaproteobacteria bacterium]MBU1515796.1 DUF885 family protein [Alphaproteobacteria bacterium]MBU2094018.1 DUF885 family protein [Alphaproteobacteria bacterium]MBU2152617.1 DUF885 family protein [Alphaproteobacteria bacterium]MBU2308836.1 DUF885 family protein [Alphaproteobacteria bacterium]
MIAAGALATLAATRASAQPVSGAAAQLTVFLDQVFQEALDDSPELVTSLGLDKGARAGAKAQLHDGSLAGVEKRKARNSDQLRRLKAIDRSQLTGMPAVNYDTMLFELQTTEDGNRRFAYPTGGSPYVLAQICGAWQEVPDFLDSQHSIETREDAQAYLSRLDAFATMMDAEIERVRHDVGLGVIPPDFAIAGALKGMAVLRQPADKSTLVTALATKAKAKGIAGDWAAQATLLYDGKVIPALNRQMALLESLKPKAVHDAGCWRLPDGEAYYAHVLYAQTTSKISPAEVHKLGRDVTAELSARADVLFKQLGFTKGTVGERYIALYDSKKGVYPNTDAGKTQIITDLNKVVQTMQKRLPEQFGTLPKAPLEIRRIPPATEGGASTHYEAASLDGSRPGVYWLNLRDTAESPYWFLPTTTYHEGIPGHHMQITLQREADLPMVRRVMGFGAYAEGWALYSEQVAQEMGMYKGEPLNELGYLHDALLRSARLVTDSGLHSLKWSREKAIAEMRAIEGDPEPLAAQEIERYAVWPGQACSYMVGKVTMLRLREKAQKALGAKYDPRKFHDAVLLSGSMPLTALENVVDLYIAGAKG